jgi:hypothetical protein
MTPHSVSDQPDDSEISATSVVKGNGKKVFGYLTFDDTKWTSSSYGEVPVDSLPWDVLTHVTLFAAGGGVPIPSSYANQIPHMTAKAHATGTYSGLCYGGSNDAALISMINTPSSWAIWIKYNLGLVDNHGLDFFEFDIEGSMSASSVYAFFDVFYDSLQTRRSRNNPVVAPFIVLTVGPSRAAQWVSLKPFVAFTSLMSYDYIGDWWGRIIHDNAPKSYQNWNGTGTNLDYYSPIGSTNAPAPSMQQAAIRVKNAGWPLDKILVGFDVNPTYWHGGSFPNGRGPTYIRQPTNGGTSTMSSDLDFNTQWPTLSLIPRDSIHFDQIGQSYWAHTGTSQSTDKLWVMTALPGRDSAVLATRRVVDSMNLGGVMIWNLGSEVWNTSSVPPGGRGWFFSQIRKHFNYSGTTPPPPPPQDVTPPAILLTAPASWDTVSGTIQVNINATDASGISTVKFKVDDAFTGASDASSPYSFLWNSTTVTDGPHNLAAEATDGAGLKATGGVWVYVRNTGTPPPPAGASVSIYDDKLVPPWINSSWGSVTTYGSVERVFEGSYAIKTAQNAWGAIMTHSGSWNAPVNLNTSGYDSLRFAVYPQGTGLSLAVWFGNDIGGTFPKVTKSNIPADRWTVISIPVAALNANGQVVHRLHIQNNTSQSRTYHVDKVALGVRTMTLAALPVLPPANLSFTPGSVVFTDIPSEEVGTQNIVMTNEGDEEIRIASVTSTDRGITVSPSEGTIAPHDSLPFAVTVASRSRSGMMSGYLIFSTDRPDIFDSVLVEAAIAPPGTPSSTAISGVGIESAVPERYSLAQNFPNPFNPTTTIGFGLPRASRVSVRVYDVTGREVATVFEGVLDAGFGSVRWDGRSDAGATLATGVYIYRIEAFAIDGAGAPFVESRRMLIMK